MGELSQIVIEQDEDCFACGRHLVSGELATRDNRTSRVMCLSCSGQGTSEMEITDFVDFGTSGGAAAQREYDRRRNRERKTLKQEMPFRIGFTTVLMIVAGVFGNHLHRGDGSLDADTGPELEAKVASTQIVFATISETLADNSSGIFPAALHFLAMSRTESLSKGSP